jgi:hypothetical protein
MATTELRNGVPLQAPRSEVTASPLRPIARWVQTVREGRSRLVMQWAVPQCPNIAAVVDSTSAY